MSCYGMGRAVSPARPIHKSGRQDLNLRPLRPERKDDDSQQSATSELTNGDTPACTNACTGEAKNGHIDKLDAIAAMLAELSPADRAALAARLTDAEGQE